MYDITQFQTFKNVELWLRELEDEAPNTIIKMLIGTKLDLRNSYRTVTKA